LVKTWSDSGKRQVYTAVDLRNNENEYVLLPAMMQGRIPT